ncbi:hypothetical protein Tsubulata_022725 [Turnera subulata]|uniref:Fe2OG dioxygenase domain-containing protein n=1 Tax=Turnera subulata TaxID=218843 RepID=A0A9Q0F1F1_9ROSI|nr:hypothetical protein Tsubulata_022725 [Turnera subulata]
MSEELGPGKNGALMELLKGMEREEILELFSSVEFCQHCRDAMESRIHKLVEEKGENTPSRSNGGTAAWSPASVNSRQSPADRSASAMSLHNGLVGALPVSNNGVSEEEKERTGLAKVGRKKDFVHMERVNGKPTNILEGLELHTEVFDAEEQKAIVDCVYNLQRMGRKRQLRARTYSEPQRWMRGKGRVTIQFGCCYNYAMDKNGRPPGIIRDEEVDPLPPLFKQMIRRLVKFHVLPPTCIPNSCIVNIYEEGDCIPPHIDHHDFLRPFCTVSFLTEANILFGTNLKAVAAGEFSGPVSVPLPCGSVLVLNGNGADIAKHCVPGVPAKRISITFRKMDDSKLPYKFAPDPELEGINPIVYSSMANQHQNPPALYSIAEAPIQQNGNGKPQENKSEIFSTRNSTLGIDQDAFPPLGSTSSSTRSRPNGAGSKQ